MIDELQKRCCKFDRRRTSFGAAEWQASDVVTCPCTLSSQRGRLSVWQEAVCQAVGFAVLVWKFGDGRLARRVQLGDALIIT